MSQPRELTDRYRLEKILGSSHGGMVLRARVLESGRAVAIKLFTLGTVADPERMHAFAHFAGELAALRHPSLPEVLDSGLTTDGSAFLVCELLSGVSFTTLGGGAPERILPLLSQALDGLEALAERGLAHHNLTPANLFIAGEQVKILGLGSAVFRLPGPAAGAVAASTPETARGLAPELTGAGERADWRADLYALAVTACQALGATIVFGDPGGPGVQMPLALSFDLANDEALRRVLEACLRYDPAARPSHHEIREGFRLALGEAPAPSPAAPPPLPPSPFSDQPAHPASSPPPLAASSPPPPPSSSPPLPPSSRPPPRPPTEMRRVGIWPAVEAPADWRAVEPPPVWPASAAAGAADGPADESASSSAPSTLSALLPPELPDLEAILERGAPPAPADPLPAMELPRRRRSALPDDLAGTAAQVLAALSGEKTPAVAVAAPAPPAAPPAGELLSIDEELLNRLAPPPAPAAAPTPMQGGSPETPGKPRPWGGATSPAAAASGSAPAMAAAVEEGRLAKSTAALAARLRGLPRPVLWGAAAAALLLVVALAAFVLGGGGSPAGRAPVAAEEPPPPPPPPPVESARAKLALAKSYLAEGRSGDAQLRAVLGSLTFAEQAALPPGGCDEIGALEQTLTQGARETVAADLAAALRGGDLPLLAAVMEVGSEQDVPPSMKADFARARSLATLYGEAQAAARRGDSAQVLKRFQALDSLQKNLRDPQELRAHAAAALESGADALGRDGKYAEALAQLEVVQSAWPERSGIKDLVKTYEQFARDEGAQKTILGEVPGYERRRRPGEALDLLRDLKPTPHLAAQVAAARKRLEDLLAQLDAQAPEVKLRDGYLLDYSRGTVVTLSFRVTDDYQVKSVKMMARPQGGRMRELRLRQEGPAYTVDIPPSFHQNGTVDFYVVATDLSGHEGYLGSAERPLQLKRRQGFERMLR